MKKFLLGKITELTGKAPEWVHFFPIGEWKDTDPPLVIDKAYCEQAKKNFDDRATDIPIDAEHQSHFSLVNGHPAPAFGWIDEMEVRDDGLWAHVKEWSKEALAWIEERKYRYLSPGWLLDAVDTETGKEIGPLPLHLAMTNTPSFDELTPLVAKQEAQHKTRKENPMDWVKELGEIFGLEDPTEESVVAKAKELMGVVEEAAEAVEGDAPAAEEVTARLKVLKAGDMLLTKVREILKVGKDADEKTVMAKLFDLSKPKSDKDAEARLAKMETTLAERDANDAVTAALDEGKITTAQKDWATKYATENLEGFQAYMLKAPVVVPMDQRTKKETVLNKKTGPSPEEIMVAKQLGKDPHELYGHKKPGADKKK